jgi:hypothetical protein
VSKLLSPEQLRTALEYVRLGDDKEAIDATDVIETCHKELRAKLAALEKSYAALERECERWRHGVPVEGDKICPNEFALAALEAKFRASQADTSNNYDALESERDMLKASHARLVEKCTSLADLAEKHLEAVCTDDCMSHTGDDCSCSDGAEFEQAMLNAQEALADARKVGGK